MGPNECPQVGRFAVLGSDRRDSYKRVGPAGGNTSARSQPCQRPLLDTVHLWASPTGITARAAAAR